MRRKTQEEFEKEVYDLVGDKYTVLGEYINNKTKIEVRHNICGFGWNTIPKNLLRGEGCPRCSLVTIINKLTKTHEQFIQEMRSINPNVKILGKYINARTKIACICNICGYEWMPIPDGLHSGKGCPKCAGKLKYSHDEFLDRIDKNIEILSQYKNMHSSIKCRCKVCGYKWETKAEYLSNGSGCPNCKHNIRKTTTEFIQELKLTNKNIEVLGEYVNNKTKIKCRCLLCDNIFYSIPSSLLRGHIHIDCPTLDKVSYQTKSQQDFENDMFRIHPTLSVIGKYNGNSRRVKIKCNQCDHEWSPIASNLMSGCGCPICASSKGEKAILQFLGNNDICYKREYRIEKCRDKNPLPFDFAIFSDNLKTNLRCLIEYDGKQHFEPWHNIKNANEKLRNIQKRDQIKTNYCKNNNIKLIRIPYWEKENIENILLKELE